MGSFAILFDVKKAKYKDPNYQPKTLTEAKKVISNLQRDLQILQQQVASLLRDKFGQSSEKQPIVTDTPPESGDDPETNKEPEEPEPVIETITVTYTRSQRNGHRKIPENLERVRIEYALPDLTCLCGCGKQLRKIGEVITEQLEIIPAKIYVIQHVRIKYAGCIHQDKVITATMPNQPIDKGLAGPGLLADILVKKYDDHLPLYRQAEIFTRHDVAISRNTMGDWVMQCADILQPIIAAMKPDLLASPKIHTDDTTVPVLQKNGGPAKTGRLWIYSGTAPETAIYEYTPTRQQKWSMDFLKDYQGYLQADAYPGYDAIYTPNQKCSRFLIWSDVCLEADEKKLGDAINSCLDDKIKGKEKHVYLWHDELKSLRYVLMRKGEIYSKIEIISSKRGKTLPIGNEIKIPSSGDYKKLTTSEIKIILTTTRAVPGKIIEVACMAHARRKFFEIAKANEKSTGSKTGIAVTAISYISKLYQIEAKIKDWEADAKKALRKREAKPILKAYKKFLLTRSKKVLPKSPIGDAVTYTLNNWTALTRYLGSGVLSIDNNKAERLMKPIAIGRKNYLFTGNDRGGRAAATIYSLIESCKLNNINPYEYLRDVLTKLPNTLNSDIRSLLPYIWKSPHDS